MSEIRFQNLFRFAAIFNAFFMGAAFISGQETMQFFTSFGWKSLTGIALAASIFMFAGYHIQPLAREGRIREPFEIFDILFGKKAGKIFTCVMFFVMTAEVIMMTSGAGAVASECFHLNGWISRAIILCAVVTVVLLGLKRIVDVLRFVGPLNIALLLLLSVFSLLRAGSSIADGMAAAASATVIRGAGSWWLSAVKYGATALLSMLPVLFVCGSTACSRQEARVSAFIQPGVLLLVWVFVICAQVSNFSLIEGSEVPNIALARTHLPFLYGFFSISILLGTFSSIIVELWSIVQEAGEEGSAGYRVTTLAAALLAYIISGLLPFSRIVNYMYSVLFWMGLVMIAALIVYAVSARRR